MELEVTVEWKKKRVNFWETINLVKILYALYSCHGGFIVFHRSDGQLVSETDCSVNGPSSNLTWQHVFSYDAIAGPTEFITSLVNSVKMVNMPYAWLPLIDGGKKSRYVYEIRNSLVINSIAFPLIQIKTDRNPN